ncbi:DUF2652 domain-containing protein [Sinomicrobium sp. M5D2P17]
MHAKGTVFIVDISGYSKFINEVDTIDGITIISRLFQAIIDENNLKLRISEIEGDAILFYRFGAPTSAKQVLSQFDRMLQQFKKEVKNLQKCYPAIVGLGLKAILHYGDMSTYTIQHFYKLFGKILIDAHRLLKNSIVEDTYVLITMEYMNGLTENNVAADVPFGFEQCDLYDIGNLCYTYFPFKNNEQNNRALKIA